MSTKSKVNKCFVVQTKVMRKDLSKRMMSESVRQWCEHSHQSEGRFSSGQLNYSFYYLKQTDSFIINVFASLVGKSPVQYELFLNWRIYVNSNMKRPSKEENKYFQISLIHWQCNVFDCKNRDPPPPITHTLSWPNLMKFCYQMGFS